MYDEKQVKLPKLTLILAESELELIPQSIVHHPQIRSYVKKRNAKVSHLLLDASYHHAAMRPLSEWTRRGRPDIVHRCLLFALDCWANKKGHIQIYVHTRNEEVIWFNPNTRLPRQYHRFIGLMEQLFNEKEIASKQELLISISKKTLQQLLKEQIGKTVLFWERGEQSSISDIIPSMNDTPFTVVLGGFPHGDFHIAHRLINKKISVEKASYTTSYLLAKTIICFEQLCCQHR